MPRQISDAFREHLTSGVLRMTSCILVRRKDGHEVATTTFDNDLAFGGRTYFASAGIKSTAIETTAELRSGSFEATGILDDDRISRVDVLGGLYDNARIWVYRVWWEHPDQGSVCVFAGRFGEITVKQDGFTVEVHSLVDLLNRRVCESTSPYCRCTRLGDSRCKVNMSSLCYHTSVAAVVSPTEVRVQLTGRPDGHCTNGIVRFADGAETVIKQHTVSGGVETITLRIPMRSPLNVGDDLVLEAGCDRGFDTCRDKFSNQINFRGEPLLPGNDQVFRVARPPG